MASPLMGIKVGIVSGKGIRSGGSLKIAWKSKNGVISEIGSESEAESEGPEGFHFLPTPVLPSSLLISVGT